MSEDEVTTGCISISGSTTAYPASVLANNGSVTFSGINFNPNPNEIIISAGGFTNTSKSVVITADNKVVLQEFKDADRYISLKTLEGYLDVVLKGPLKSLVFNHIKRKFEKEVSEVILKLKS